MPCWQPCRGRAMHCGRSCWKWWNLNKLTEGWWDGNVKRCNICKMIAGEFMRNTGSQGVQAQKKKKSVGQKIVQEFWLGLSKRGHWPCARHQQEHAELSSLRLKTGLHSFHTIHFNMLPLRRRDHDFNPISDRQRKPFSIIFQVPVPSHGLKP